jgi:hypothetical protein
MKTLFALFVFSLLFFAAPLLAQQNDADCTDIVYLKEGSELRGKIVASDSAGNFVMTTWNGVKMTFSQENLRRIVQKCKEEKRQANPYDFKEHGLYNATRFGTLIGQTYYGENAVGYTLYHSVGWMFNRWVGAGIGGGAEIFSPDGNEVSTYPLFAEVRGYFQAKNVTPFYAVGGGWAFTGNSDEQSWGYTENWKGGWLAKVQIGYRMGNHFTLHGGISLQKKTRDWQSVWGGEWGQDRILHKRLELGIGVIL